MSPRPGSAPQAPYPVHLCPSTCGSSIFPKRVLFPQAPAAQTGPHCLSMHRPSEKRVAHLPHCDHSMGLAPAPGKPFSLGLSPCFPSCPGACMWLSGPKAGLASAKEISLVEILPPLNHWPSFSAWEKPPVNAHSGDFPGSPVVKILCFHCKGHGFNSRLGN